MIAETPFIEFVTITSPTGLDDLVLTPAERGAALLDAWFPTWLGGWESMIDLDRLDLSDSRHCILGQLFDSYESGLDALFGDKDSCLYFYHGFEADTPAEYRDLTEAWRQLILARRATDNGPLTTDQ